jgi:hypothetical protein
MWTCPNTCPSMSTHKYTVYNNWKCEPQELSALSCHAEISTMYCRHVHLSVYVSHKLMRCLLLTTTYESVHFWCSLPCYISYQLITVNTAGIYNLSNFVCEQIHCLQQLNVWELSAVSYRSYSLSTIYEALSSHVRFCLQIYTIEQQFFPQRTRNVGLPPDVHQSYQVVQNVDFLRTHKS